MTPSENRARLIKLIHVARRELGMEEDAYRAILRDQTGQASSTGCSVLQLERVLGHLKRCGFKVRQPGKPEGRALDMRDMARKARAVWLELHALGGVESADEAALAAYVRRVAGVDDLRFLRDPRAWLKLIESLKKWAARVAVQRLRELWLTQWTDDTLLAAWVRRVVRTEKDLDDLPYEKALAALVKLRGAIGRTDCATPPGRTDCATPPELRHTPQEPRLGPRA